MSDTGEPDAPRHGASPDDVTGSADAGSDTGTGTGEQQRWDRTSRAFHKVAGDAPTDEVAHEHQSLASELRSDLFGQDSWVGVLVLTLFSFVIVPLDALFRAGSLISILFIGSLLLLILRRAHARMWLRATAIGTTAVALVAAAVALFVDDGSGIARGLAIAISGLYAMLFLLAWPAVIRRGLAQKKVTLNTVAAAIASYLIIGLFFSALYRFISLVDTTPFFAQKTNPDFFDFEYYSFITLTTVGYGDLTPATNAGRSAAVLEALTGQIVLVTMVASVVANIGRERRGPVLPTSE